MNKKDGRGLFALAFIVVIIMLTALVKDVTATPAQVDAAPITTSSR